MALPNKDWGDRHLQYRKFTSYSNEINLIYKVEGSTSFPSQKLASNNNARTIEQTLASNGPVKYTGNKKQANNVSSAIRVCASHIEQY